MNDSFGRYKQRCDALGLKPTARLITVSIARQLLGFYRDNCLERSFVVSTSLRPPSNVKDSLGTPRGLHEIAEKVGAGQPPGIVFKARVATGKHFSELGLDDQARHLITTRILWLGGLEPGLNQGSNTSGQVVDTKARYIYIHGTNHEELLGRPSSIGCIEMNNIEIIGLFDEVRTKDHVWIED
ncbi:MAG TPA: L,D-transpeptidase [Lacunisphaera sp.]|nr:L,D-transpeptidase [Lacunisphaera sp.]